MSAGCTIRLATAEDGPGISALVVSLARYLLEDPDDTGSAAPFFETVSADAIGGAISGGRFIYHLAEAGGGLVGAVGVRDGCHLYHLFVAEGWQGRGVGGALWRVVRTPARCPRPPRPRASPGQAGAHLPSFS